MNWQLASRDGGAAGTCARTVGTQHVGAQAGDPASVFLAPESFWDESSVGPHLDVFSPGDIAWQLFTGRLPAAGAVELQARLRNGNRFGEELLQIAIFLEDQGVYHRDIKPDNIGLMESRSRKLQLVLFDFSLAKASVGNLQAGTRPYLDPCLALRKPPRWDLYAERFAVAMTLYELVTGTLPLWGDGQSDPSMIDQEATLDAGLFDPNLREGLTAFPGWAYTISATCWPWIGCGSATSKASATRCARKSASRPNAWRNCGPIGSRPTPARWRRIRQRQPAAALTNWRRNCCRDGQPMTKGPKKPRWPCIWG